jgi:hypothetical protein
MEIDMEITINIPESMIEGIRSTMDDGEDMNVALIDLIWTGVLANRPKS